MLLNAERIQTVAYCHCDDCRRWTGAPLTAFAAVAPDALSVSPELGEGFSTAKGVRRWVCNVCGSGLAATFDYLPDQIYVPVGLFDDLEPLGPELHCHAHKAPSWLHVVDDLPRANDSGRDTPSKAAHD